MSRAIVTNYAQLVAFMRARSDVAKLSRLALDAFAGLADGHSSTLLSPVPSKRYGWESLFPTLDALEVDMVLIPRDGGLERIADLRSERHENKISRPTMRSVLRIKKKARLERIFNDPHFFKKIGRTGGRARAKRMTKQERILAASRAVRVRWKRKPKAAPAALDHPPGAVRC